MPCRILSALVAFSLLVAACSDRPAVAPTTGPISSAPITTATTSALSRPPFCSTLLEGEPVGVVESVELDEISGAALSRSRPGVMWLHNDSGDEAAVYAVTTAGEDLGRVLLPDLTARDWEDMAIGPGPDPSVDYLYIADIGDNNASHDEVLIHRIPEPAPGAGTAAGGETLRFTYPTGPVEAETLLVDQATADIVIATKALSGVTQLFGLSGELDWATPQQAVSLGEIRLGAFALATGGDAGTGRILIRTYDEVFGWERQPGQSLIEALLTPGCRVASVSEEQGEAIALAPDGSAFYTVSEGLNQPIYRFQSGDQ